MIRAAAPSQLPQLTRLVDEAPAGDGWLHEIKYIGYRMHAGIDGGQVMRTGLDWWHLDGEIRTAVAAACSETGGADS